MIKGLITKASGIASHAAVMARANGIPCIVGYQGLEIDPEVGQCEILGKDTKSRVIRSLLKRVL